MTATNDGGLDRMNALAKMLLEDENYFQFPNWRPKDAATLILLDRSGRVPKVLLGKRHHGHKFMPGKFVFPGGGLEPADRRMGVARPLHPQAQARLMQRVRRPSPAHARALALGAIRETGEETGLLLGTRRDHAGTAAGAWAALAQAGILPDLGAIHFIGPAIPPPRRAQGFCARFFTLGWRAHPRSPDRITGPHSPL